MPQFSIVITVYNKEKYITRAINSVLSQTVQEFEIIVIDDGSTDHSTDVIANITDPRITIYSQSNQGASAARNLGIQKSNYEFIAFLDGDDEWYPNFLEEINDLIQIFPNHSVFATAIELQFNHKKTPATYSMDPTSTHQSLDYFKGSYKKTLLSASSCVIKQSVFRTVLPFDESLISGEDTDLWIRIGLQFKVAFSSTICVTYHQINDSLSNTSSLNTKDDFLKFKKYESENEGLKKVLDLNRFSLAVLSKKNGYKQKYLFYKNEIDINNLNTKQKILLRLPRFLLIFLSVIKTQLDRWGVSLRVFG